ncbi:MAG: HAD hydrolase-like protein, partial [Proteobacteria bacterium]|nr:HAD hydrolase-like protein [Pseudomonadota bacterium]
MTAKLEAIVFDLDGTLIDSAPELASALNSGLSEAGRRRLDVEEVITMIGDGIDTRGE